MIEVTEGCIKVGDDIHVKGHTTDFLQKVNSMQSEHENADMAVPGASVGIKMDKPVRANDLVYKNI